MKAIDLRKKTIKNFTISLAIVALLGVGLWLNNKEKQSLNKQLGDIKKEVSKIQRQSADLESKRQEITTYINIWKELDDNKKSLDGINMDEINLMMKSVAKDNFIFSTDIKLGLPQPISSGVFNTKKIDVLHTKAVLTFKALDDASIFNFLDSFFTKIPGYYTITDVRIDRRMSLSNQDLLNISKGRFPSMIESEVQFYWYVFKSRDLTQKNGKKSKRLIKL